jgi:uncharacterized protein (DUF1778 family)
MVSDNSRTEELVARITPGNKAILQEAAALQGESIESFVIRNALENAEKALREPNVIRLNEEQSRAFAEAILAPPRPVSEAFKEAGRLHRERVVEG